MLCLAQRSQFVTLDERCGAQFFFDSLQKLHRSTLGHIAEHNRLNEYVLREKLGYVRLQVIYSKVVDGVEQMLLGPALLTYQHGHIVDGRLVRLLRLKISQVASVALCENEIQSFHRQK